MIWENGKSVMYEASRRLQPAAPCLVRYSNVNSRLHADAEPGAAFVFLSPARVAWIRAEREAGTWSEGQSVLNNVNKNSKSIAHRVGLAARGESLLDSLGIVRLGF